MRPVTVPVLEGGVLVPAGIRLLATDLDGTLLGADERVAPRTRAALDAVRAAGIEVLLVTGRPPRWLPPVADDAGHTGMAIGANGAVVVDLAAAEITAVRAIAPEVSLAAVEALRSIDAGVTFAVEWAEAGGGLDAGGLAIGAGYQPRWPVPDGTPTGPIEALLARDDVIKLLARPSERLALEPDTWLAQADDALRGMVEATHSGATGTLVEVSPRGVDKGSALAAYAAERGLRREQVVAVGDMPNDLPMLRWAGTGFAVANAHPAVRHLAAGVLPAHDDDGVAVLLEALAGA